MHDFLFYLQVSRNPKTVVFSLVLSADSAKWTGKKVLLRGRCLPAKTLFMTSKPLQIGWEVLY